MSIPDQFSESLEKVFSSVKDPDPHVFLYIYFGLPYPDPLVRGMNPDPAPDPSLFP
jgi:hypothetical protein